MHLVLTVVILSRDDVHFSPISPACISYCFCRPLSSLESICDKKLNHCTHIEILFIIIIITTTTIIIIICFEYTNVTERQTDRRTKSRASKILTVAHPRDP